MSERVRSPDKDQTVTSDRGTWETPELREISLEDGTEAHKPGMATHELNTTGHYYGPPS
jgi:hypothetical protein